MRILFAGTPEISVPSLDAISASRHEIVGVLTAPDRQAGRGRRVAVNPVKARATELGLPVLQPERLGSDARIAVGELGADLIVCVAYRRIFGPKFLSLFEYGGINLHPSLLPRHRGPAPIPAAILSGDTETGVTVQALALEMDGGDILGRWTMKLSGSDTTGSLTDKLGSRGGRLVAEVVEAIAAGTSEPVPQAAEGVTYTKLIRKADGEISWGSPAQTIGRAVRAYNPWPLAFTTFRGRRLSILESSVVPAKYGTSQGITPGTVVRVDNDRGILVETGDGQLALTKLQLQSRKVLSWNTFLNGVGDFVGAVLGG